jgi:polar amino acid transport system ATP-binding protein
VRAVDDSGEENVSEQAFITVRGPTKAYARGITKVLDGLDLDVTRTDRLVVGPSGGGKSTLLRCVMGLEEIDAGKIGIDGKTYISCAQNSTVIDRTLQKQVGQVAQGTVRFAPVCAAHRLRSHHQLGAAACPWLMSSAPGH